LAAVVAVGLVESGLAVIWHLLRLLEAVGVLVVEQNCGYPHLHLDLL
jgi:predicted GNAT family N-acyltransferase